jgi:hypothetical protein
MTTEAEKIMDNIIRLAELLDEETLRNASEIRFIDLARSVSFNVSKKSHRRMHGGQDHKSG